MKYPVRCDCGKVYHFAAARAGSHCTCACGRELVVPSLSRLKLAAGEEVLRPAVRIEQMLRMGMLPEETRCVTCGTATTHAAYVRTVCERPFVKQDPSRNGLILSLGALFLGSMGVRLLFRHAREDQVHGADVSFRLPLRVCPTCVPGLTERRRFVDAVLVVPLYAELLEKYPAAELTLDAAL